MYPGATTGTGYLVPGTGDPGIYLWYRVPVPCVLSATTMIPAYVLR